MEPDKAVAGGAAARQAPPSSSAALPGSQCLWGFARIRSSPDPDHPRPLSCGNAGHSPPMARILRHLHHIIIKPANRARDWRDGTVFTWRGKTMYFSRLTGAQRPRINTSRAPVFSCFIVPKRRPLETLQTTHPKRWQGVGERTWAPVHKTRLSSTHYMLDAVPDSRIRGAESGGLQFAPG